MGENYLTKLILQSLLICRKSTLDSLDMQAVMVALTDYFSYYIELREVSLEEL